MTGSARLGDLFAGPAASSWEDLGCYTGLAGAERIVGDKRRAAYIANYNQMDVNYRGGVEFQLRRNMVLLCPQTAQFLYQSFTPERMSYSGGPRRYLEDTVHRVVAPEGDASEKVLALMRFCRDLYKPTKRLPSHRDYVYGGTEEELIKKGEWTCECLSRLFVALCELVGVSGRVLYHAIGGHVTTEVFLGTWAYIDPRMGMYFVKANGGFASAWELWNDPSIMATQDAQVRRDVSDLSTWQERQWSTLNVYFHPCEVNGFSNYSLADTHQYDYTPTSAEQATMGGLWTINREYRALIEEVFQFSHLGDGRQRMDGPEGGTGV